jgi:putative molybdopterin biosynthesis protein
LSERRIFHELVHPDEVERILRNYVRLAPLGVETVSIEDAHGRILAEDVYSPSDVPPFDRSEVDGYAVVSSSLENAREDNPAILRVVGTVRIGHKPDVEVHEGEAAEIDTGAVIPRGADAVVMVEYTRKTGDNVVVYRSVASGENVARAGSDVVKGEILVRAGSKLGHLEVGALAAAGVDKVRVFKRPRICVASVGSELRQPGTELELGEIYDTTTYALKAALRDIGAEARSLGILPDEYDYIKKTLGNAMKHCDVIIPLEVLQPA